MLEESAVFAQKGYSWFGKESPSSARALCLMETEILTISNACLLFPLHSSIRTRAFYMLHGRGAVAAPRLESSVPLGLRLDGSP
jgi:hypothetical protein